MAYTKLAYINDPDIWAHISTLPNFSQWVRDKARAEIRHEIDPVTAAYIDNLINQHMGGKTIPPAPVMTQGGHAEIDADEGGFL